MHINFSLMTTVMVLLMMAGLRKSVDWNCELIDLFALYFSFVISGILGEALQAIFEGEAPKSLQARYCFRWKNFKAVAVHGETDHHNAVSLCS